MTYRQLNSYVLYNYLRAEHHASVQALDTEVQDVVLVGPVLVYLLLYHHSLGPSSVHLVIMRQSIFA